MKKRYIEHDLPIAEISHHSAKEKNIRRGHPSTLHIWWARRPLASSRATNFAALIDLPDAPRQREEINDIIGKIVAWEVATESNNQYLEKSRKIITNQWTKPPKILDPFSGGGSIPLEALRLGCEAYSSDYNPVAVLIEKATLEWPQKFGIQINHPKRNRQQTLKGEGETVNLLAYMVEKWAKNVFNETVQEIGKFYPKDSDGSVPIAYLWARTIPCQNPACEISSCS